MTFADYTIVDASSPAKLIEGVNNALSCGWTLYGHPFTYHEDNLAGFCQAMVKVKE